MSVQQHCIGKHALSCACFSASQRFCEPAGAQELQRHRRGSRRLPPLLLRLLSRWLVSSRWRRASWWGGLRRTGALPSARRWVQTVRCVVGPWAVRWTDAPNVHSNESCWLRGYASNSCAAPKRTPNRFLVLGFTVSTLLQGTGGTEWTVRRLGSLWQGLQDSDCPPGLVCAQFAGRSGQRTPDGMALTWPQLRALT